MGPQEDYIETVLTCEGDFYDPEFHQQLDRFSKRLQELITSGEYCDSFSLQILIYPLISSLI